MTQHSDRATNPEPAVESEASEGPVAGSPAASRGGVSAQVSAIDLAFDQEIGGKSQASQEDKRIGRVGSVSGSRVIVML